jgi:hypothetical protein
MPGRWVELNERDQVTVTHGLIDPADDRSARHQDETGDRPHVVPPGQIRAIVDVNVSYRKSARLELANSAFRLLARLTPGGGKVKQFGVGRGR